MDSDADGDFYLMRKRIRMRIQVTKMMRIRLHITGINRKVETKRESLRPSFEIQPITITSLYAKYFSTDLDPAQRQIRKSTVILKLDPVKEEGSDGQNRNMVLTITTIKTIHNINTNRIIPKSLGSNLSTVKCHKCLEGK